MRAKKRIFFMVPSGKFKFFIFYFYSNHTSYSMWFLQNNYFEYKVAKIINWWILITEWLLYLYLHADYWTQILSQKYSAGCGISMFYFYSSVLHRVLQDRLFRVPNSEYPVPNLVWPVSGKNLKISFCLRTMCSYTFMR
jgi:hypothetical protein